MYSWILLSAGVLCTLAMLTNPYVAGDGKRLRSQVSEGLRSITAHDSLDNIATNPIGYVATPPDPMGRHTESKGLMDPTWPENPKELMNPTWPKKLMAPMDPTWPKEPPSIDNDFTSSFVTAFSLVAVSEFGDKTFLIGAIMAMRHCRKTIFIASILALSLMTILSATFGFILPNLIPKRWMSLLAAGLFIIFGFKMIKEGIDMSPTHLRDEYEQVTNQIDEKEESYSPPTTPDHENRSVNNIRPGSSSTKSPKAATTAQLARMETGSANATNQSSPTTTTSLPSLNHHVRNIFSQTFILVFLAEWGDRSQIATIVMAASKNVYGVTLGAIVGHAACTGLAVGSGRLLATVFSIQSVTIFGGMLFICFGLAAMC